MTDKSSLSSAHKAAGRQTDSSTSSSMASQTQLSSDALLRGRKVVTIHHNGMLYTLQATKLGKLILTK